MNESTYINRYDEVEETLPESLRFSRWKNKMDRLFSERFGIGLSDMVDIDFYNLFLDDCNFEDVLEALADVDSQFNDLLEMGG